MEDENRGMWYQPGVQTPASDNAEERDELRTAYADRLQPPQSRKKPWGAIAAVSGGVVLLLALIIGTAVLFARPEEEQEPSRGGDFFEKEWYSELLLDETITGENTIPRAALNPEVQLELQSAQGLEPLALQELYDRCAPSVVGVTAQVSATMYSWGTGIIMTEDGYILTNTHVLDDASSVEISLQDGSVYEAKLVGADAVSDVSLLKIEATGLPAARFANSDEVAVGDRAVAIGNPLSGTFSGTMTDGIISGLSRTVTYGGRTKTLLQTNAALNEGNSGGPLFNIYGQVIGITNMKMMNTSAGAVEGIGFAIPTTTVKEVADALLATGEVTGRPCLGVYVYEQPATEEHPGGLMVESVSENSDAARRGIRAGDILTAIDGEPITDSSVVSARMQDLSVGDTVELTIWREGREVTKTVELIDQNDF